MRIISKHHDYYDCGVAFGIDPKITYVRLNRDTDPTSMEAPLDVDLTNGSILKDRSLWSEEALWYRTDKKPPYKSYERKYEKNWLFFCGKQYFFRTETFMERPLAAGSKSFTIYSFQEEWIEWNPPTKFGQHYLDNQTVGIPCSVNDILGCPIVIAKVEHKWKEKPRLIDIHMNPCLKDYGVHGKFGFSDPYWVFNEISMWLGKKNQEGRDAVQPLTEQQKVEQHGFHYKQSFRHRKDD